MKKLALLFWPLVFLTIFYLGGHSAKALIPPPDGGDYASSSSPVAGSGKWKPSSTTYPGSGALNGDIQPYYVVGNNRGVYNYPTDVISFYVPNSGTQNVSVEQAGPACYNGNASQGTGLTGPDYSNTAGAGPATSFYIADTGGNIISGGQTQQARSTDGCSKSISFNFNASSCSLLPNNQTYGSYARQCYLYASVASQSITGENSFTVVASGATLAGLSGQLTGYGYRDTDLNNGNYWTSQIVFSVNQSCSNLNPTTKGDVVYQDADAAVPGWNPKIQFELQRETWTAKSPSWSTVATRNTSYLTNNNNGAIVSNYSFSANYRYRLVLQNVGVRNTVFVGFSDANNLLSQMSGEYHLESSDCGVTYSCTSTPSGTDANLDPNQAVAVKVTFKNTGAYTWTTNDNPATQYRRSVDGTDYSPVTIPKNVAPGGSFTVTFNETAPSADIPQSSCNTKCGKAG